MTEMCLDVFRPVAMQKFGLQHGHVLHLHVIKICFPQTEGTLKRNWHTISLLKSIPSFPREKNVQEIAAIKDYPAHYLTLWTFRKLTGMHLKPN